MKHGGGRLCNSIENIDEMMRRWASSRVGGSGKEKWILHADGWVIMKIRKRKHEEQQHVHVGQLRWQG